VTARSEILFISDLHLDQNHPEITQQFLSFIETRATQARVLYILGDLFEVWIGDDDEASAFKPVFNALHQLSQSVAIYFIHGNRDFLIGEQFANRTGMHIIHEPAVIQLGNTKVGLMHGDLLCTDDIDYQNFRQMVRDPEWQEEFLAQSLEERRLIATQLRDKSSREMKAKETEIMDVTQQTVIDYFDSLGIDVLIHGHTHRPALHKLDNNKLRFVLGDWHPEASYLCWKDNTFTLIDTRV
jgi:UDP-2,3-diacylglucosamine hydrolase